LSAAAEDAPRPSSRSGPQAEMAAEDQHAALRADVLLAVAAAGHDLAS
jgi:hypothetical protein